MARKHINIGSSANDGTGDTLRTTGQKINETFVEIYQKFGGGDSNSLSSQISIEDSAIVFEGSSDDAFETRLIAQNVRADANVRLPDSTGTLITAEGTASMLNKTMESPALIDVSITGNIKDSSGNIIIGLDARDSAVNYLRISNGDSGRDPRLNVLGDDTNINMSLVPKGTGAVLLPKVALSFTTHNTNNAISQNASYIKFTNTAGISPQLDSGTVGGEIKAFTVGHSTGAVSLTINTLNAIGVIQNPVTMGTKSSLTLIWDEENWNVVSYHGNIE